jgi:iron complex transport system substrate-binding protein/vitamin B12 transport system substrate-binding protein
VLKNTFKVLVGLMVYLSVLPHAFAQISVTDDRGALVQLSAPARRVITLSPHATELVFAAGGGPYIAATVDASDFPKAARTLPRIGAGLQPEPERLLRLKPDLLIGWQTSQFSTLHSLRIPLFLSAPKTLDDIPDTIDKLGVLLDTQEIAQTRSTALRALLDSLKQTPPPTLPVRVFLQVGETPEYTLNRTHLLSQVIEACGGLNVFGSATAIAPKISAESVLAQRPELILLGRVGAPAQPALDPATQKYWSRLNLPAAQARHSYVMDSDVIYRPGPRLIEAAQAICSMIQQARK